MGNINYNELDRIIEQYRFTPMEWGINDCAKFAALILRKCVGIDALHGLDWENEEQGQELIKDGFPAMVDKVTGFKRILPLMAQRMDLCWIDYLNTNAIGVCVGKYIILPSKRGLRFISITKASIAWRVE